MALGCAANCMRIKDSIELLACIFLQYKQCVHLQNSEKLGPAGKCVTVRAGYARNHLIPAGHAALASKTNRAAYQRTDDEARRPVRCICGS